MPKPPVKINIKIFLEVVQSQPMALCITTALTQQTAGCLLTDCEPIMGGLVMREWDVQVGFEQ